MAANLITVTNIAGYGNVVLPSTALATIYFPANDVIVTTLAEAVVINGTSCVTSVTSLTTNTIYYTSTTAATIGFASSKYAGSTTKSFQAAIAGVNTAALIVPSTGAFTTVTMGFPADGVMIETITVDGIATARIVGTTSCVTKITMLRTNTVYFTATAAGTLAALTA
jgi:hypothetical protein